MKRQINLIFKEIAIIATILLAIVEVYNQVNNIIQNSKIFLLTDKD